MLLHLEIYSIDVGMVAEKVGLGELAYLKSVIVPSFEPAASRDHPKFASCGLKRGDHAMPNKEHWGSFDTKELAAGTPTESFYFVKVLGRLLYIFLRKTVISEQFV